MSPFNTTLLLTKNSKIYAIHLYFYFHLSCEKLCNKMHFRQFVEKSRKFSELLFFSNTKKKLQKKMQKKTLQTIINSIQSCVLRQKKKFAVSKSKLFYPPFCNLMSSPDQILSFLRVNYYLCFFFTTILKLVGQAAGLYLNLKFKQQNARVSSMLFMFRIDNEVVSITATQAQGSYCLDSNCCQLANCVRTVAHSVVVSL